ncbi:MAG: metal ABC transporter permease [Proteobacteria bacterium]|nr:metal ABC transporter permease [Pseudomonadota bacterium]
MDALSLDIVGPAFLAGLLVLATHVPFGSMVLDRGIVFIDIAIAQVAALGVVLGASLFGELAGLSAQISAFSAAILASLLLIWTERRFGEMQEAIIGVVFVLAASLQIIALSASPGGAEHLKELLVGQILLVTPRDLLPVFVVYAGVLAVWMIRDLMRERMLFYTLFAVIITLSVQMVGVLLVFASLIVPALAVRSLAPQWRLVAAFNIGVIGYLIGLVLSALRDLPTGATIVCTIVATAVLAATALGWASGVAAGNAPAESSAAVDAVSGEVVASVAAASPSDPLTNADVAPLALLDDTRRPHAGDEPPESTGRKRRLRASGAANER